MGLGTSEDAHMRATMIVCVEGAEVVVASYLTLGFQRKEGMLHSNGSNNAFRNVGFLIEGPRRFLFSSKTF